MTTKCVHTCSAITRHFSNQIRRDQVRSNARDPRQVLYLTQAIKSKARKSNHLAFLGGCHPPRPHQYVGLGASEMHMYRCIFSLVVFKFIHIDLVENRTFEEYDFGLIRTFGKYEFVLSESTVPYFRKVQIILKKYGPELKSKKGLTLLIFLAY